ncbi:hypothetical protein O3P69_010715 [Scylla paramamosain]|uniref:BZIP domain-containing protein n=1 Tax=Scylla paramamosain TaxID=85552 RepID=A0AAW0THV5_SCYPA
MASRSYFDLLWEVEEVSTGALGKVAPRDYFEWRGDDEGVGGGLPSQCVSDDVLSEALLGDPFLPLLDEDALQPPPPALPHPETLMQVSLPAGQPAAPGAAPAASPPRPPSPAPSSPLQLVTPQVSSPASPQPLTGPSSKTPSTSPRSPVRVVVRTGRMVAPVMLEKSSRYLVRIPGPTPLPPTAPTRHLSLQEEEKPEATTPTMSAPEASLSQESSPPQASPTPDAITTTTATTLRSLPSRGGARRRRCSSSSSTSSTVSSNTPFRSLRGGGGSGAGSDRFAKRKAYELDPQEDPDMERCRLNAINARRNRELKKARMAELEKLVQEGDRERDRLLGENRELREGMAELQREVKHLTNILRNQSRLSHILDKVSPVRVSLSDAVPVQEEQGEDLPGGVCLHVDGNEASLEICSVCAKKASKKLR